MDKSRVGTLFALRSARRRGTPTSGLRASEPTLANLALNLKRTPEKNCTRHYRVVAATYKVGQHIFLESNSCLPLPMSNMGRVLKRNVSAVNKCPR